ncbi:MAG: radical SAM protein [Deltaproteobacteria bacterium]|nr:radical SAM protein [Deltaproteobacteria bacterium]MBW2566671.1 radical SAM protein [Deltaproteobacteria bacterium]
MNIKKTSLVEIVCARYCSYYKPSQKQGMACQGFKLLQQCFDQDFSSLKHFPPKNDHEFKDRYPHLLHHTLCRPCDFLIDGCDFKDPKHTGQSAPCGGYVATEQLLAQSFVDEDKLLKTLVSEEEYVGLSPNCVLRHLEKPYLYDLRKDELYELDQVGFEFLKKCTGRRRLSELSPDKDFLETCLREELVFIEPHPHERRSNLRPSPIPSLRYLELQLTSRCNLKCKHCYLGEPTSLDLPLSAVLSVLEEFEDMQGLRVLFSGGEPLLYPHLGALNETLPIHRIRKVLLTNGTLVTTKNHHDWCHFDEIQFSLDGLQAGHERMRGTGTFEQTMRGIEAARERGIPISIATMIHRHNIREFEALAEWIDTLEIVEWNIDVPCAAGRLPENAGCLVTPEKGAPFLKFATGGSYHGSGEPYTCGYHLCTVTPEGNVLKCGFFKERPLGSLKEGLEISWKRARPIPLSQLECASCPHVLDCKGGCRFRAESPLGKDPVMCALYRV